MQTVQPQALIPMVIETSGRMERAYDIYSLLLKNRIVFVGTQITDQTANLIIAQLLYLSNEDAEAPIQMYINSPGGQIYAGLAIYDTMQMISNPINTVAVGVTASFSTILLTAGTKGQRFVLPHSTVHLHQPLGGAQGQATDIEIQTNEILRLRKMLNGILSHHTGQPEDKVKDDTERDYWLTAQEAVDYGLVDKVLEKSNDSILAGVKKSKPEEPKE
ncbi:MAG: ATP-dependent Clp protease proteolytic subunit, partial [Anaerolineales bacterium]|nr:ATP-dependent Clp protease proteolytic subunit [Anaerolineales bacterium]